MVGNMPKVHTYRCQIAAPPFNEMQLELFAMAEFPGPTKRGWLVGLDEVRGLMQQSRRADLVVRFYEAVSTKSRPRGAGSERRRSGETNCGRRRRTGSLDAFGDANRAQVCRQRLAQAGRHNPDHCFPASSDGLIDNH